MTEEEKNNLKEENPQSRKEKILAKLAGLYDGETEEAQSRNERWLLGILEAFEEVKEASSQIPDWNVDDKNAEGFIKNKPPIKADCGGFAVVEGSGCKANFAGCHAEGEDSVASAIYAHAEGYGTKARGRASHAEGWYSESAGIQSHAEGYWGTAKGDYSHQEGYGSQANGKCSHAEGNHTIAAADNSHVVGSYNLEDTAKQYAEIVGNGTNDKNGMVRSNARTLDWSGNEWLAGKLTVGAAPTEELDVTTKKYVDDLIADLQAKIDALTPAASGE